MQGQSKKRKDARQAEPQYIPFEIVQIMELAEDHGIMSTWMLGSDLPTLIFEFPMTDKVMIAVNSIESFIGSKDFGFSYSFGTGDLFISFREEGGEEREFHIPHVDDMQIIVENGWAKVVAKVSYIRKRNWD